MSARFPQDVTDMILPLDQSMQHIQYEKNISGAFRFIILEFLFSSFYFQNEDEFTIKNYNLKTCLIIIKRIFSLREKQI